jgi:hypothetical protein
MGYILRWEFGLSSAVSFLGFPEMVIRMVCKDPLSTIGPFDMSMKFLGFEALKLSKF